MYLPQEPAGPLPPPCGPPENGGIRAVSFRLRPSAIHLGIASGPGTGLTAQFRRLAGGRLVQLALGRARHDPAHLGPQVSPATGELAQRSHRGGLFIRGQLAPRRVMFRLARDLGDANPVSLRTLTGHAF